MQGQRSIAEARTIRAYRKVRPEKREILLKMVLGPAKIKIKEAAELLGIKYTRALNILREYDYREDNLVATKAC